MFLPLTPPRTLLHRTAARCRAATPESMASKQPKPSCLKGDGSGPTSAAADATEQGPLLPKQENVQGPRVRRPGRTRGAPRPTLGPIEAGKATPQPTLEVDPRRTQRTTSNTFASPTRQLGGPSTSATSRQTQGDLAAVGECTGNDKISSHDAVHRLRRKFNPTLHRLGGPGSTIHGRGRRVVCRVCE